MTPKKTWTTAGTLLADVFFLWVIVEYAMGGWQLGLYLLTRNGIIPWLILPAACGLGGQYNLVRLGGRCKP